MDKSTFIKLREHERENRRSVIIDATMALFERKPFTDIGMRDIAMEAGVSPASIYRYFPSQDDLFVEALIYNLEDIKRTIADQYPKDKLTIEDLADIFIDYLVDHEATFQMMSHFMIRGKITARNMDKFNTVQRFFLAIFDQALKKSGIETDVRSFSHACYSALIGVVMTYRNYPEREKVNIREHMHKLARIIINISKIPS